MSEDQTNTEAPDLLAVLQEHGAAITVHEPERVARAAAVDEQGVVVGVELIDADAPPERDGLTYVEVHDDEPVQAGWTWDGQQWEAPQEQPAAQDYAAPREDDAAVQSTAQAALTVADAVLALLLSAQSSNPVRAGIDWPTVLEGLVERGGAGRAELDGALAWGLIDAAVHADLVDLAESPGA